MTQPRTVERIVAGQATSDGAGVKLSRVLTQQLQRRLDPFLMLDAFGSDKADELPRLTTADGVAMTVIAGQTFVLDFAAAWGRVMNLDRFDLK